MKSNLAIFTAQTHSPWSVKLVKISLQLIFYYWSRFSFWKCKIVTYGPHRSSRTTFSISCPITSFKRFWNLGNCAKNIHSTIWHTLNRTNTNAYIDRICSRLAFPKIEALKTASFIGKIACRNQRNRKNQGRSHFGIIWKDPIFYCNTLNDAHFTYLSLTCR